MESVTTLTAPREWLGLPEAREAIKQRYGERAVEIIDTLRELLPEGFPHRIGGWNATHRQWPYRKIPFPAGYDGSRWPAWLTEDRLGQMQVQDWELAQVDWEAGTVRNLGGHRSPIELRWRHVTEWVRTGRIGALVDAACPAVTDQEGEAPGHLAQKPQPQVTAMDASESAHEATLGVMPAKEGDGHEARAEHALPQEPAARLPVDAASAQASATAKAASASALRQKISEAKAAQKAKEQAEAHEWMQRYAGEHGCLKRAGTIQACVDAIGCGHREAEAAWMALKAPHRRKRGRPKLKRE